MRLQKDNEGVTALQVIAIIGIVILSWEVIGFSMGYPTIISTIQGDDDLYYSLYLVDKNTGVETLIPNNLLYGKSLIVNDVYELQLKTNAPYSLFGDNYRFVYDLYNSSGVVFAESTELGITGLWSNTFSYDMGEYVGGVYQIHAYFYNPNGVLLGNYSIGGG